MSSYNVYYGEYTLKYWINMILNKEIILPPYQRYFVWSQEKVEKLIGSLLENQYIPPIVIGSYKDNEVEHNYVLDGQQRLSAILLAWLGCFPKGKGFAENIKVFGNYNDDKEDNDDSDEQENIQAWKFTIIQELIHNGKIKKDDIKEELIKSNQYQTISDKILKHINKDFFESKKLGFSYVRPKDISDSKMQKRYFSTMFRNINISAVDLTPIESRSSLYWLDEGIQPFLQPDEKSVLGKIKIDIYDMDFARYIALLSEYRKHGEVKNIAKGFVGRKGKTIEQYIEDYIYYLVDRKEQNKFYIFKQNFNYSEIIQKLNIAYESLEFPVKYTSIIDADYYLFGLFYYIVFTECDYSSIINNKSTIVSMLEKFITESKETVNHAKTPNALKYLRYRIESSIDIYRKFI